MLLRQATTLRENQRLTATVAARERELRHLAFHDPLTGLANRALVADRLDHAIELHRRELRPLAVLLLDLDDFKRVNDSLGYPVGDELLIRVAERVRAGLRAVDTVARSGAAPPCPALRRAVLTTLQASLHAADRPVVHPRGGWMLHFDADLLGQRREPHYRGPWRLPGPDLHRQAA